MPLILGIIASAVKSIVWEPASAYDSLATTTLSAATSSITFNGIPTGYKHLQLRVSALTAASGKVIAARFNSDTNPAYTWNFLNGQGTTASGGSATGNTYARFFAQNIGTNTTNPSVSVVDILDYSSINKNKTVRALSGCDNNGSGEVSLESSLWINASAISSITILLNDSSNFSQYSSFALYGVK